MVNHYKSSAAVALDASADITKVGVASGHAAAKASLEAVYPALGITCRDVGGYTEPKGSRYVY
jgi:hypothetical protein